MVKGYREKQRMVYVVLSRMLQNVHDENARDSAKKWGRRFKTANSVCILRRRKFCRGHASFLRVGHD